MPNTLHIAVPTEGQGGLDAPRSAHFGRADSFTLVSVVDGAVASASVLVNGPHEHGGCGAIVQRLAGVGVAAVIAGGMGGGPRAGFAAAGVPVYFVAVSRTPREAVEAYLAGARESFGDDHQCAGH
jgi:predicted Fe-Mo cluster-binding NifX family protein